jgi:probable F420-dependent oxidoreductase
MQFVFVHPEPHAADGEGLRPDEVVAVAAAAEQAGFGAYACTEHPAPPAQWLSSGGHQTLDPFVTLGFVAAATTRIRLLTYLAVAPYRNPSLLAKAAASVDVLSGGRLTLGLGAGYLEGEFDALGVPFEERSRLLDEALDVLPRHWSGVPFSYEGKGFVARDILARPAPVQHPIPIWIGGNSRASHRRIAERAQGWMPLVGPPALSAFLGTPVVGSVDELAASILQLREAVAGAGRDPTAIDVLYPYADADVASVDGHVERHREAFGALESVGVTWVALSVPVPSLDGALEAIEHLGASYLG